MQLKKKDFYAYSEGHARWIIKEIRDGCPDKGRHFSDVPTGSELLCIGDFAKTTKTFQWSPRTIKKMIQLVSVGGHFMIGRKSWSKIAEGGVYSINEPQED